MGVARRSESNQKVADRKKTVATKKPQKGATKPHKTGAKPQKGAAKVQNKKQVHWATLNKWCFHDCICIDSHAMANDDPDHVDPSRSHDKH